MTCEYRMPNDQPYKYVALKWGDRAGNANIWIREWYQLTNGRLATIS